MNEKKQRNDLILIIGLCLILFGAWKLAEHFFGSWIPDIGLIISRIASVIWPIAIIVIGVVIVVAVSRGSLPSIKGRKLYRARVDRKLGGVCGGIATFLGINSPLVRIITIILALFSFFALVILYIVLWVVIPEEPENPVTWM